MKIKGLKSRVTIGFMGIATLLLLSGLLSFFELSRLSEDTDVILRSNRQSMEFSRGMIHHLQSQNYAFVQIVAFGDRSLDEMCMASVEELAKTIKEASVSAGELELMDSMMYNVGQLRSVTERLVSIPAPTMVDSLMLSMGLSDNQSVVNENRVIYNEYQPIYTKMLSLIDDYLNLSQNIIAPRAESLRHNAYRAVTPVFISLMVMIIIVLLLYYFMMLYCVMPIISMNSALGSFMTYRVPFAPKAECRDEVEELRDKIEQLTLHSNKAKSL